MTNKTYSAYFPNFNSAKKAVESLRNSGLDVDKISLVSRQDGELEELDGAGDVVTDAATDIAGKAALGGGIGALLGVAALAIPGVGPFVAAGAIAQAAVGGAALAGTAAGATLGGIAGALENHGISADDAEYYSKQLENGGVLVAVEADEDDAFNYGNLLYTAGGYSSTRRHAA